MYVLFFQPNSSPGGNIPQRTSSFLAAVTGSLKAFSPQSKNPLSTTFLTGKALKICRLSAALIVSERGPRKNPGKTRTQRRQNKVLSYQSKMFCVRRFLKVKPQSNICTSSGMLDLTCWIHVTLMSLSIANLFFVNLCFYLNLRTFQPCFHDFSWWACIWIFHHCTQPFWYYSTRVTKINNKMISEWHRFESKQYLHTINSIFCSGLILNHPGNGWPLIWMRLQFHIPDEEPHAISL